MDRADHEHIEPGNVIENEHATLWKIPSRVLSAYRNGQDRERLLEPETLDFVPFTLRKSRVPESHDKQAVDQVEDEARNAYQA
jgi:hypothetical protein